MFSVLIEFKCSPGNRLTQNPSWQLELTCFISSIVKVSALLIYEWRIFNFSLDTRTLKVDKYLTLRSHNFKIIAKFFPQTINQQSKWKDFLNSDSLYARLNSHYETWSYKKRKYKKIKHTNLFRKNI